MLTQIPTSFAVDEFKNNICHKIQERKIEEILEISTVVQYNFYIIFMFEEIYK